jgi:hypothetical protein
MRVEPGSLRRRDVLGLGVAADRDEPDPAELGVCAHRPRDLVPVHARQADVAEHDVGMEDPGLLDAFAAVVRDLDGVLVELERLA